MFSTYVSLLSPDRTPSPQGGNENSDSNQDTRMSVGLDEIGRTYSNDPQIVRTNRDHLQEQYENLVNEHMNIVNEWRAARADSSPESRERAKELGGEVLNKEEVMGAAQALENANKEVHQVTGEPIPSLPPRWGEVNETIIEFNEVYPEGYPPSSSESSKDDSGDGEDDDVNDDDDGYDGDEEGSGEDDDSSNEGGDNPSGGDNSSELDKVIDSSADPILSKESEESVSKGLDGDLYNDWDLLLEKIRDNQPPYIPETIDGISDWLSYIFEFLNFF